MRLSLLNDVPIEHVTNTEKLCVVALYWLLKFDVCMTFLLMSITKLKCLDN